MNKKWWHFWNNWQELCLVLVLVFGLWLRTVGLSTKAQVDLVQTDFGRDILVGRHIMVGWGGWMLTPHSSWELLSSSPAHFWLVGLAYVVTGSEVGVYYLYAFASMLLVWLAWKLGKRIGGDNLGLLVALVSAVSPVFIGYATLVSQTSLVPVLAAMTVWGIVDFFYTRRISSIWVVLLAAMLMMLLHNSGLPYGLFIVVTMAGLLIVKRAGIRIWLQFVVATLLVALAVWQLIFVVNNASVSRMMSAIIADLSHGNIYLFIQTFLQSYGFGESQFELVGSIVAFIACGGLLWWKGKRLAKLWLWLLASVVLVMLAPISTIGLQNHFFGPWLPILVWSVVIFPWLMMPGWISRTAKLLVLGGCVWLFTSQQLFQPAFSRALVAQAPFSLMQILHADAIQTGFIDEGFEIWTPIWELSPTDPRANMIADWYSGGWWFLWERLERVPRVQLVPISDQRNNIKVKVIGGGVYAICPDDLTVDSFESEKNVAEFNFPTTVMGNQWLSQPTAECVTKLWRQLYDDAPQAKTWVLGRVLAPGSKTGAYSLVKYHQ